MLRLVLNLYNILKMKSIASTLSGLGGAAHRLIQDDLNNQLKTKLSLKADLLKEIEAKKGQVEAELERIKLEVREINMKHKSRSHEGEETTNGGGFVPSSSMDPSGTKLHFKLSEIVLRPKKQQQSSPVKK
jgi:hypothetical protein